MAVYCPISDSKTTYLSCQECDLPWCKAFFCLVIGSEAMSDYAYFQNKMDFFLQHQKHTILLTFQESGFGEFVKRYADAHQCTLLVMPDAEAFGYLKKQKQSGAVMFWDGQSTDMTNYLRTALSFGIPFRVVGQWK